MRFSSSTTSSVLAALLTTSKTVTATATCAWTIDENPLLVYWDIWADNVYGIPGWCGGLWDNLNGQGCAPSATYCGGLESSRIMNWRFYAFIDCTEDKIKTAWYEATKNEFGSIECNST